MKNKVKMTFEVVIDSDLLCDEETLKEEYNNSIYEVVEYLYENDGCFWSEELKLMGAEFVD